MMQAVIAGMSCAVVSTLIALCAAFGLNLAFEARAESRLHQAFAASGMDDPGAFLVRTMLVAASEALVRMPAFALVLSSYRCLSERVDHQAIAKRCTGSRLARLIHIDDRCGCTVARGLS